MQTKLITTLANNQRSLILAALYTRQETAATCRGAASGMWFEAHVVFSRQLSQGATVLFIPWQTLPFSLCRLGTQWSLGELAVYCYRKPRGFGYPALLGSFATLSFKVSPYFMTLFARKKKNPSNQKENQFVKNRNETDVLSMPCYLCRN